MDDQLRRMHDAAKLHYIQGETMSSIARKMNVSRSTVSRLLKEARDSGIVQVSVALPPKSSEFGDELAERFGIKVRVVGVQPGVSDADRLTEVCRASGRIISESLVATPEQILGLAWGTTISEMVRNLVPAPEAKPTVVQLNGAANQHTFGIPYASGILVEACRKLNGRVVEFPVPAFFDNPKTRELLWNERSIKRVLDIQRRADIAVFGVGSFGGSLASHVYSAGYLTSHQISTLRADKVVGDVCTVMLRADGSWRDLEINKRASGLNPDELANIKRRICVVGSPSKAVAMLAALKAGVATELILDELTAQSACQLLAQEGRVAAKR